MLTTPTSAVYRLLGLCAIAALLLAGCGPDAAPTATVVPAAPQIAPTAAGSTTGATAPPASGAAQTPLPATATSPPAALSGALSFLVFGEPAESKAFFNVAQGFETANPGVKVNTIAVPSQPDHLLKLSTMLAAGAPPDVWIVDYRRFGSLQNSGVIDPAGPHLAQSTVIHATDFFTKPLQPFTVNGVLQCIPLNMSSLEVYYNKDLFDRAHVPYPQPGWTWNDFLQDAIAITKLSTPDNQIYGAGIDPQLIRLAPFVWENGGDIVDNPDHPTRFTLDSPPAKEAFQWFVDLQTKYHVIASEAEAASEQDETRFLFNTLGMWLLSRRVVPALRTASGFTWDVAPLPAGKQLVSILHTDGYCIAAASKNKDLAWKFVEYANGPEGQTITAQTGRSVPSLQAVAHSPAYLDPSKLPAHSQAFLDMGPYLRSTPQISTWPDIELRVNAAIAQAFYGHISVDDAIREINTSTAADFQGPNFPSTIVVPTPFVGRPGEDD
ncbi:MAG TPA: sugar ABC transporter substrate-binding protein [Chloroflexia bacterium]|nr:sugar ABC transporter substrate-binding protein [Chloroflexia bacterium]